MSSAARSPSRSSPRGSLQRPGGHSHSSDEREGIGRAARELNPEETPPSILGGMEGQAACDGVGDWIEQVVRATTSGLAALRDGGLVLDLEQCSVEASLDHRVGAVVRLSFVAPEPGQGS